MSIRTTLTAIVSAFFLAGCASVAVNEDSLQQRTSLALGLSPDQFTIFGRSDSALRTDYSVRTNAGANYSCYVSGMVSVTGRLVSDAMCKKMQTGGGPERPAGDSAADCNALLRAAGKCE